MKSFFAGSLLTVLCAFTLPFSLLAQNQSKKIVIDPRPLPTLEVNERLQLSGTVYTAAGDITNQGVIFYSLNRESVAVTSDGQLQALQAGTYQIVASTVGSSDQRITKKITVTVEPPPLQSITIHLPQTIYANTTVPIKFKVKDIKGQSRPHTEVHFTSSNPRIAEVDEFGRLRAKTPGPFTLTAQAGKVETTWNASVTATNIASLTLNSDAQYAKTGDVVTFHAVPKSAEGNVISDIPISYSFTARPDDSLGASASGQISQNGKFVANKAGLFTITAKAGAVVAERTIRVEPRNIQKELKVVGHGLVNDVHTSDLWVWEGIDGRDYAVTGTWGGDGEAYFWDVTNPSQMTIIDTITVDARTVNDVKISKDGRIGVLTREGASNRKNGIVILDVSDPHNVSILSEYTDGLTGGVHNAFIYKDHVFAVNNGRRYDIIDISNPEQPVTVSRVELDTPGHAVHDVWVKNGIAYSSNWDNGVVAVDVGSTSRAPGPDQHEAGIGSFTNPVKLGSYSYPSGWTHAAFPFQSQSTGDFYIVAGDEAFPNGLYIRDKPTIPAGWIHFIKFEQGWDHPDEVARYQLPEAGTHNFWIQNDTLYVAYYNAGLRVVDISGELMGNLYKQGREIAKFVPTHRDGFIPNAAMTWGPQPHKGYIFISDWNSGIWALKLEE